MGGIRRRACKVVTLLTSPSSLRSRPVDSESAGIDLPFHESVEHHKQQVIKRALTRTGGSQTQAAELLSLQRTYLARLIKQMGIR